MDDKRRAEIEERLAAATPGPWRTGMLYNCNVDRDVITGNVAVCHINRSELGTEQEALDAAFIANAPAALHDLLAGAVPLLELAARVTAAARCEFCPVRAECHALCNTDDANTWLCNVTAAQLRELAQGLRALAPVPEAGAEAEAGEECPSK